MASNPAWELPRRLDRLKELSYNLWWSWHPEARALFKAVDGGLWRSTRHNPVLMLQRCGPRLKELCRDEGFLERYDNTLRIFDQYMAGIGTWFKKAHPEFKGRAIAYFSAEFGLHNSLRIYSGGLGILAGDHCKIASDLGVPLVGVGFMYPQGYVQQRISMDGWQRNVYEQIDWDTSPVRPALDESGSRVILSVKVGSSQVSCAVWEVVVGRVRLYLMDTHVEANSPNDREISGRLYGGDRTMRLRQEIILGIGGVKLLKALKIPAAVFHANEGHCAFLFLERIRELVEGGKTFEEASREVSESSVFTTHTPVPAGHDVFAEEMIAEYFKDYWPALGLDREKFLELGRAPGRSGWNMTALALRLAGKRNGVSRRHGHVSRKMFADFWPGEKETPISHVTNGVHIGTWVNQELSWTFARYLADDWQERQDDPKLWARVSAIPDSELWRVHQRNKDELFKLLRNRARTRWIVEKADPSHALAQGVLFDPLALTIGFARRFAAYKRATLILKDLERLKKILLDPLRPVQILFAGKAHPDDDGGKRLIQEIYLLARDPAFGGRIAFVEDYDMHLARYLVQGCDLWLNTPEPPLEACGTSGIKAAINGVPNLSVLDGWWLEGYNGKNGWALGSDKDDVTDRPSDSEEADTIYGLLEKEVVPLFYDRGHDGIPYGWIKVMKDSIRSVAPGFCGERMVKEYVERFYMPSLAAAKK